MKKIAVLFGSMALKHFGPIVLDKAKEYAPMLLDDLADWGRKTAGRVGARMSEAIEQWVDRKMSGRLGSCSEAMEPLLRHHGVGSPQNGMGEVA